MDVFTFLLLSCIVAMSVASAGEVILCDFEGAAGVRGIWIPKECMGKVEVVSGKESPQAAKITFLQADKSLNRYFGVKEMNPQVWVQDKRKVLKFWVKGDGAMNIVKLIAEHYDAKLGKSTASIPLGFFSLEDPEWKLISLPLEDKYETLKKTDSCYFQCPVTDTEFSFTIDQVTLE